MVLIGFNYKPYFFCNLNHNNYGDFMIIRLGYVALSKTMDITTSKTITYTDFIKNNDYLKIDKIIKENLENLEKIIDYNIKNNIHFYRLSSKLIPLATKDDVEFEYINKYKSYYDKIAKKIKKNNLRVDFHPDQFCVLNSTKKEIVENSINILEYQYKILDALKVKDKIIILHVGSSVLGKENSIKRFINNFNKIPNYLQKCIAIENDDKVYNIEDCLKISKILNIPVVLDYHHHICNNCGNIENYIEEIFKSWKTIPKIHFSSPKNKTKKEFRSHHDYINIDDFINFLNIIKSNNFDFDIMIEAKAKDEALFRLTRQLKYYDYKFIDETTFINKR